jgi:thioredoxin-related protein
MSYFGQMRTGNKVDTARRRLLGASCAVFLSGFIPVSAQPPQLTEDGLHRQPWFIDSFLVLDEDLSDAQRAGRIFLILWELRGCPACKLLHLETFADAEVQGELKARFHVLQLNFIGQRPVTDFDGQRLSEKDLAGKHGVASTPTLQFYVRGADGKAHEIHRANFMKPAAFLDMLRDVKNKADKPRS